MPGERVFTVDTLKIDSYRLIVFPNTLRTLRKEQGFRTLLALSKVIHSIPYIRLSKIERGEVFANASEINTIAIVLDVAPEELLIDVDAADFDIAHWAAALLDWQPVEPDADRFAVLLGAAVRVVRTGNPNLTISEIDRLYGIAPVILSRIEHALKPLERWNATTIRGICDLFGVKDEKALRAAVQEMEAADKLKAAADAIAHPSIRTAKTSASVAQLRAALTGNDSTSARPRGRGRRPRLPDANMIAPDAPSPARTPEAARAAALSGPSLSGAYAQVSVRLVPVFGAPLSDGRVARTPLDCLVEAPQCAGPNAFGLRVCRSTLGLGLPATATVIVDPDRFPSAGGLAVIEEEEGLRLLAVTFDRHGRMMGYSDSPNLEIEIDGYDPAKIATVVGAVM
jgi:hypothetical protein